MTRPVPASRAVPVPCPAGRGRAADVFADAPGGSQVPESVIEAMAQYLRTSNSNHARGVRHRRETDEVVEEARRAGGRHDGRRSRRDRARPERDDAADSLSRSFGRTLGPGDEIVVTMLDHDANVRPWILAAEDAGATVRWVDVHDDDVTLDLDSFDAALSDRTRLVAFTLASNAVGTIPPAAGRRAASARRGRARRRRRRALRPAPLDRRAGGRRRHPRVLAVQVLRAAPRHAGRPPRAARRVAAVQAAAGARRGPRSAGRPARRTTRGSPGSSPPSTTWPGSGREFGAPAGGTRRDAVVAAFDAIARARARARSPVPRRARPHPRACGSGASTTRRASANERRRSRSASATQHPAETAEELGRRGVLVWDGHYYAITVMERLGLLDSGGAVRDRVLPLPLGRRRRPRARRARTTL